MKSVVANCACDVGGLPWQPPQAHGKLDPMAGPVLVTIDYRIQADKRSVVLQALNLTDAQVKGFTPIYDQYQRDLESVGEFIRLYCSRYGRWASPKYLIGESYGGYLARALVRERPDQVLGLALICPIGTPLFINGTKSMLR